METSNDGLFQQQQQKTHFAWYRSENEQKVCVRARYTRRVYFVNSTNFRLLLYLISM